MIGVCGITHQWQQDFHASLRQHSGVDLRGVALRVKQGGQCLILEGSVAHIAAKRMALTKLRQLAGKHRHVDDCLNIKTSQQDSGALRNKVARVLLSEPEFERYNLIVSSPERSQRLRPRGFQGQGLIHARILEGTVSLAGQVTGASQYHLAELVMWWIQGCRDVINRLRIIGSDTRAGQPPGGTANCASISERNAEPRSGKPVGGNPPQRLPANALRPCALTSTRRRWPPVH
ncbi:hypothetical protein Tel_12815 [Candidatus Tenderia electrophaga]|jgi:hypothetical protein|uniref:Uncharacterized protein n=1 Tax=Candidatus Tenderia electrophaga TaxID=1748243 RepID=A0A0S2TFN3_9GAMM|nr:hypothetical protein Tel_12815 [Candidatus Tenderia electrophaga]